MEAPRRPFLELSYAMPTLAWTRKIIDACGPRPAGSAQCLRAAEMIADDLRTHCDRVEVQPFECHPHAFIWHVALLSPITLLACGLLATSNFIPAALLLLLVAAISILEFGHYRELVDPLFPRRRCTNVMGVLEPQGPVHRQVVLSAHHDSAYEFRFMRHSKAVYIAVLGWVALGLYGLPLVAAILGWLDAPMPAPVGWSLALFGGIGAVLTLVIVSPRSVPGAGDNLVCVGVLVTVAGLLRERLKQAPAALQGTRVIFASFDAEESGLRGSRAFVRDQRELLRAAPTCDLNLESFFHLDSLCALVSDLNGTVALSEKMVAMLEQEARALGVPFCRRKMFYGIGATDAAEFAKAGIPATCLVGMSPSPLHPKPLPYHTRDDLPENLEPEAIAAGIELSLQMVLRIAAEKESASESSA